MPREPHVAIKVWDLPVRLFHWVLVLLLVFQFVTGKIGGNLMPWHVYSGYAVLVRSDQEAVHGRVREKRGQNSDAQGMFVAVPPARRNCEEQRDQEAVRS